MKQIFLSCIILIAYLLQITIMPEISIFGISPNLILIIVCSTAFLFGATSGGIVGFFCGLLLDLYYGRSIGLNALLFLYIGLVLGKFNKRIFKDNYFVILIFMVLTTYLYELIIYVYGVMIYSQDINILSFFINASGLVLVNTIFSIFIYPVLLKINLGLELDRNIFR